MAGGAQGAGAPAQGGANTFGGNTNPTPYQGSAAPQDLGQATGAQGFNGNSPVSAGYQQMQNNAMQGALGAVSAPAGGGQTNMMKPVPAPAGGPYGGFNAQGQNAVDNAQSNYNQSGGQGQLTPPQQAAIAYNANPQGQPAPQGMSDTAYAQPAMLDPNSQAAMDYQSHRDLGNEARLNASFEAMHGPGSASRGLSQDEWMQGRPAPQGQQGPMSVGAFSPQSPMGGFPQQPQGAGPDVTGNSPAVKMGYDQSGSDAGIGGQAVQGVQNPAGMGGQMSSAGGPYGGIMAGRPAMDQGEIPPSLSQMRPQKGGLQVQGNPTAQPFMRKNRAAQQR